MRLFVSPNRWIASSVFCLTCLVTLAVPNTVAAAPIKYDFTYTSSGSMNSVPSFSFSFELPNYVITPGTFALPAPITVGVGTSPGSSTITHAGADACGNWIFGTADESIFGGCFSSLHFADGPAFAFRDASPAILVTAPGTVTFAFATGATQFGFSPQQSYGGGTASLTVTDLAALPEPVSVALFGVGLAALGMRRRRNQQE